MLERIKNMMPGFSSLGNVIKPFLPMIKKNSYIVDFFIKEELAKQEVNSEDGEYAAFVILSSKKGDSYIVPVVMSNGNKVIKQGDKAKLTDFLIKLLDLL